MKSYAHLTPSELQEELAVQRAAYDSYVAKGLKLNMARGKPAPEQLDLSMPLLDTVPSTAGADILHQGAADDLRNYGGLPGIGGVRTLMGDLLGVDASNVVVAGNSSLTLMHNAISLAMTHGVMGSTPWAQLESKPKFLCPSPGYDRHFAICEHFGIEMIVVPLAVDGPNMDVVESLVADPQVKGIWCVPRFANPTGCVYSDETVERMAALKPAAADFRVYWDNAYAVHELYDDAANLMNFAEACKRAGNDDLWYQFASTSKVTFAGSGIAAIAASDENIKSLLAALAFQSIGPDKINQERHVQFLPTLEAVKEHMAKHAALIKPKFEVVLRVLEAELSEAGIGQWTNPKGGYFISFDGPAHTAKRTVELATAAGVVLTPAGATYPYGNDPEDANIRIAPTYPSLEELEQAAKIFTVCARIAAAEAMLA